MTSYKKIIAYNKAFADAHHQIETFENGELWQSGSHNQQPTFKYPLMFLQDLPHSSPDRQYVYRFRAWFRDKTPALKRKEANTTLNSNYNEVKSRMIEVAKDFIAYWVRQTDYPVITVEKSFNITTFVMDGDDMCTGCYVDIGIVDPFDYNECVIPMDGVPAEIVPSTLLTVNGEEFVTIGCGEDYNLVVKDTNGATSGSKVGSEWIVPAAGAGSIATTVNGGAAVASTDPLAINVRDTDGNLKGTNTIDSANTKEVTVADSDVTINTDPAFSLLAEEDFDLDVQNSEDTPVGAWDGDKHVIGDSPLEFQGNAQVNGIPAEETLNVEVFNSTFSIHGNVLLNDPNNLQIQLPDTDYEVYLLPFPGLVDSFSLPTLDDDVVTINVL